MHIKLIVVLVISLTLSMSGCTKSATPPSPTDTLSNLASPTLTYTPYQNETQNGKAQGDTIVVALNNYYSKNGYYPDSLDELVPDFLNSIPVTSTGQQFFYKRHDYEIYLLTFPVEDKNGVVCGWSGRRQEWECSHGHG